MVQFGFGSLRDDVVCRVEKTRTVVDAGERRWKWAATATSGRRWRTEDVEREEGGVERQREVYERERADERACLVERRERVKMRIAIFDVSEKP